MPINEARQFGWATACVLSAESSIRDKLLGEEFCQAYERLLRRQWQRERSDISDTERRSCLDC
jgi:glutamine synthetase